ncbi:hypothetical protein PC5_00025 [Campylobacter phage PC5]|nr:hypothetical protein FDH13_gp112 [Campylobacter phage vB_CjeM_Los1]ANH51147.1 hypothetical protein PC5_00025 [Campylobacter phage PC5]QPX63046.1 hypothetical protein F336_088 [Campylobacter phage F336]QPX63891.1 hypothetical protein F357_084 [Campylobacter phage F357]QPX64054.1 hypothetical protein F358_083 [Campylobacter phage F358]QPX64217.1 hypothetical protein F360_084 [Campylobacter phage F360]QPX64382.1 hypothetical protein F361_085 [Campylobacter phage F361]QPX64546.1 hypothetical 
MKIKELICKFINFKTLQKIITIDRQFIIEGQNGMKYSGDFFFVDEGGYICKISDGSCVGTMVKSSK